MKESAYASIPPPDRTLPERTRQEGSVGKPKKDKKLTLRLNLNQLHPRILRSPRMHTILEVPKPGFDALTPDPLNPRVVVAARGARPRDADPVLVRGVVENDLRFRMGGQVAEFGAVGIGEEEEVGSAARGDGHGAGDGLGNG